MTRYLLPMLVLFAACGRDNEDVEKCAVLVSYSHAEGNWGDVRRCLISRYDWSADDAFNAAIDLSAERRAEHAADSLVADSLARDSAE